MKVGEQGIEGIAVGMRDHPRPEAEDPAVVESEEMF